MHPLTRRRVLSLLFVAAIVLSIAPLAAAAPAAAPQAPLANDLRISQVYGGGGQRRPVHRITPSAPATAER
ncbi:MAG: hypothetical protein V9H69_07005 [Anaerolineae bacterium]